jgi:hypothetical protein
MVKLIKRIGLFAYIAYLWKLNLAEFKRIISFLAFILFSFLVYPDLKNLLKDLDLNYLVHAFIFKWLIITFFSFLIYKQLRKIDWRLSAKKVYKIIIESKNEQLNSKDFKRIKDIKEIEEDLSKFRDIKKYPKLKTKIEEILEGD